MAREEHTKVLELQKSRVLIATTLDILAKNLTATNTNLATQLRIQEKNIAIMETVMNLHCPVSSSPTSK